MRLLRSQRPDRNISIGITNGLARATLIAFAPLLSVITPFSSGGDYMVRLASADQVESLATTAAPLVQLQTAIQALAKLKAEAQQQISLGNNTRELYVILESSKLKPLFGALSQLGVLPVKGLLADEATKYLQDLLNADRKLNKGDLGVTMTLGSETVIISHYGKMNLYTMDALGAYLEQMRTDVNEANRKVAGTEGAEVMDGIKTYLKYGLVENARAVATQKPTFNDQIEQKIKEHYKLIAPRIAEYASKSYAQQVQADERENVRRIEPFNKDAFASELTELQRLTGSPIAGVTIARVVPEVGTAVPIRTTTPIMITNLNNLCARLRLETLATGADQDAITAKITEVRSKILGEAETLSQNPIVGNAGKREYDQLNRLLRLLLEGEGSTKAFIAQSPTPGVLQPQNVNNYLNNLNQLRAGYVAAAKDAIAKAEGVEAQKEKELQAALAERTAVLQIIQQKRDSLDTNAVKPKWEIPGKAKEATLAWAAMDAITVADEATVTKENAKEKLAEFRRLKAKVATDFDAALRRDVAAKKAYRPPAREPTEAERLEQQIQQLEQTIARAEQQIKEATSKGNVVLSAGESPKIAMLTEDRAETIMTAQELRTMISEIKRKIATEPIAAKQEFEALIPKLTFSVKFAVNATTYYIEQLEGEARTAIEKMKPAKKSDLRGEFGGYDSDGRMTNKQKVAKLQDIIRRAKAEETAQVTAPVEDVGQLKQQVLDAIVAKEKEIRTALGLAGDASVDGTEAYAVLSPIKSRVQTYREINAAELRAIQTRLADGGATTTSFKEALQKEVRSKAEAARRASEQTEPRQIEPDRAPQTTVPQEAEATRLEGLVKGVFANLKDEFYGKQKLGTRFDTANAEKDLGQKITQLRGLLTEAQLQERKETTALRLKEQAERLVEKFRTVDTLQYGKLKPRLDQANEEKDAGKRQELYSKIVEDAKPVMGKQLVMEKIPRTQVQGMELKELIPKIREESEKIEYEAKKKAVLGRLEGAIYDSDVDEARKILDQAWLKIRGLRINEVAPEEYLPPVGQPTTFTVKYQLDTDEGYMSLQEYRKRTSQKETPVREFSWLMIVQTDDKYMIMNPMYGVISGAEKYVGYIDFEKGHALMMDGKTVLLNVTGTEPGEVKVVRDEKYTQNYQRLAIPTANRDRVQVARIGDKMFAVVEAEF